MTLSRGRPLRQVGRKALRDKERRADVRAETARLAGDRCQAATVWPQVRCFGVLDTHEVIQRSLMPNSHLDTTLTLLVCRGHHMAIEDDHQRARELGLEFSAWEVAEARQSVTRYRLRRP